MLIRSVKLVVHHEDGESAMLLSDLRRFLDAVEGAVDGDIVIETGVLYDGAPADIISMKWAG